MLFTPFRYPPLKYGSRFGPRDEPTLFYGALGIGAVLAESAYYRFVFWHGMAKPPSGKVDTQHTLLEAEYRTSHGLQLQAPPFAEHRELLTHPSEYKASQELGSKMRKVGIEVFEFISARDPKGGINVALFTPDAFSNRALLSQEPWLCELTGARVKFSATHGRMIYDFPVEMFYVDGKFPQPA